MNKFFLILLFVSISISSCGTIERKVNNEVAKEIDKKISGKILKEEAQEAEQALARKTKSRKLKAEGPEATENFLDEKLKYCKKAATKNFIKVVGKLVIDDDAQLEQIAKNAVFQALGECLEKSDNRVMAMIKIPIFLVKKYKENGRNAESMESDITSNN